MSDELYRLLVERGYPQHEAHAIASMSPRSSSGASDKFKGCVTCGSTEYPHDCNAPEPSERQPDGYAYRYPDGYIRFSGGREVNGSDPVETIPYYFRRAPEPAGEPPEFYRLHRKDDAYDAQFFPTSEWDLVLVPRPTTKREIG